MLIPFPFLKLDISNKYLLMSLLFRSCKNALEFYFSIYLFVFRDSVAQPFPLTVQLNNVHIILLYRSISSASMAQSFFPEQFVGR